MSTSIIASLRRQVWQASTIIVLDFEFQSPKDFGKGEDDPSRASQDSELSCASLI